MANVFVNTLICPITYCLFSDPVCAEDGHTYERSAIITWIEQNGTSPLTRETISIAGLRPNLTVRNLIQEFRQKLNQRNYKFKLGVDIERSTKPFFQTVGKSLYEAKWIGNPNGPRIILLKLFGARAEKEASFYEQLTRHPHIVYTYGLVEPPNEASDNSVMLLQEMAIEGSLSCVLEHHAETNADRSLHETLINRILIQIASAMIFLASKNIVHGDIACRNILVFHFDEREPERTLVKLTDFGISRGQKMYSKIEAVQTVIDTIPIRSSPPEVLQDHKGCARDNYSEKTDMYSMGTTMWEIYSNGKTPWSEIPSESVVRQKVISGQRLSRPTNCRQDTRWNLILQCMAQNPDDRPTFQELETKLQESLIQCSSLTVLLNEPQGEQQKSDVIDDKNTLASLSNLEIQKTSTSSTSGYVKKMLNYYEKLSVDEKQHKPHVQIRASNATSSSSEFNKNISPREDLIKLTKWH